MDPTDPIRRVSAVSTGQVQIHPDHLLELGHVPGVGSQRRLRDATVMINTMRLGNPDLVILPAHDPAAASRLARATGQVPTLTTA